MPLERAVEFVSKPHRRRLRGISRLTFTLHTLEGPGYNVAERSLAISIMRFLWSFDITPISGTPLPLDPTRYPSKIPGNAGVGLPVTLTVRSAEKKVIIDREYEEQCRVRPQMVGYEASEHLSRAAMAMQVKF